VRKHSPNDSPEHSGWRSEMLELSSWVSVVGQVKEFMESNVMSEERSGELELLASDNDNLLTSKKLMSDL